MILKHVCRPIRFCHLKVKFAHFYSASLLAEESLADRIPLLYCENSLSTQTSADDSKLYRIPVKETNSIIIDGFHKKFRNMSEAIGEHTYIVRAAMSGILDRLQQHETEEKLSKLLLYGPRGSGKSMCMLHAMQYCHQMGWLLVYIPNAYRLVWTLSLGHELLPSSWKPDRLDQPTEALLWLKTFELLNKPILAQLKTSQSYSWGKRERTEKDEPLLKIAQQGVSRGSFATDAIGVLFKELKLQKEFNVLFAVDKANCLYGATNMQHSKQTVDSDSLALIRHFRKLIEDENSFHKGCHLMEITRTAYRTDMQETTFEPEHVLSKKGIAALGSYDQIHVDNFTEEEYSIAMRYFHQMGWITKKELSDELLKEVDFFSRRNPVRISRLISGI